ncbi:MAG: ferritin family protein [Candidatus Zixiibacteriota bacterium]
MAKTKQEIAAILKKAIKGEVDGYFFYDLLSQKATNEEARRKLQNLRDDENRHKETLYAIFDKHIGEPVGELPEKGINALADVFRKGHLSDLKSEMEFINLAIEAELAATKYYQQERGLVADPEFRAIFDNLAAEEHQHFELLQAEKEALGGNYSWFGYDDGAPLED